MKYQAAVLLAVSLMVGCGNDAESEFEHACEHLGASGETVTADADATADAPDISQAHTPYAVTLVAVEGGNGGTLTFIADETGEYGIVLSDDIPLAVTDPSGAEVSIEESEVDACGEGTIGHAMDLDIGSYLFTFGPTEAGSVELAIEHLEHEHEE